MATSSLRRQMKNIVNNFSEAEVKVREATSNDPWGPSSSLMSEIADLTYNVVAFSEIMSMIWKRLNDHGKNWRHVYKALTLLDYLIKTGSERVAQQCKENIFAIQTLKDFQYVDRDGKDQGVNVREKSKQLVALLRDEDRLRGEREHALKTKERLAQGATGMGSNNKVTFGRGSSQPNLSTSYSDEYGKAGGSPASYHGYLEQARPQTSGEEELQLQLALAMSREEAEQPTAPRAPPANDEELQLQLALSMSKEEHDKEERMRRGDDLRLQMALEESKRAKLAAKKEESSLLDLVDAFRPTVPQPSADPWGVTPPPPAQADPWGGVAAAGGAGGAQADPWPTIAGRAGVQAVPAPDPWLTSQPKAADPWSATGGIAGAGIGGPSPTRSAHSDPWGPPPSKPLAAADPWGVGGGGTPLQAKPADPWGSMPSPASSQSGAFDPFTGVNGSAGDDLSEFDSIRSSSRGHRGMAGGMDLLGGDDSGSRSPDAFELSGLSNSLSQQGMMAPPSCRKTPESFLGPNAALVNLDSLVSKSAPPPVPQAKNPFLGVAPAAAPSASSSTPSATNPFQLNQPPSLTLNQLRSSPGLPAQAFAGGAVPLAPMPLVGGPPLGVIGMGPLPIGMPVMPGMPGALPMMPPGMMGNVPLSIPGVVGTLPPQPLAWAGDVSSAQSGQPGSTNNPFLL
ncbi:epsin-2 isoform X3 [Petromyzon marinus]|uniref:Epsin-2-like isoform X3 n=1 Tax=Petromyzon marinus TaxID=7757 RepID=A0AAJ7TS07_PETMA|nr:epsin-2-like isoform X3 [Petromyzon marinus]